MSTPKAEHYLAEETHNGFHCSCGISFKTEELFLSHCEASKASVVSPEGMLLLPETIAKYFLISYDYGSGSFALQVENPNEPKWREFNFGLRTLAEIVRDLSVLSGAEFVFRKYGVRPVYGAGAKEAGETAKHSE